VYARHSPALYLRCASNPHARYTPARAVPVAGAGVPLAQGLTIVVSGVISTPRPQPRTDARQRRSASTGSFGRSRLPQVATPYRPARTEAALERSGAASERDLRSSL
jgi:hypothetical protein